MRIHKKKKQLKIQVPRQQMAPLLSCHLSLHISKELILKISITSRRISLKKKLCLHLSQSHLAWKCAKSQEMELWTSVSISLASCLVSVQKHLEKREERPWPCLKLMWLETCWIYHSTSKVMSTSQTSSTFSTS